MRNSLQDLRFALRQMRRAPGFALTAVLILALGIAANVIVFGVLQTMILQPLNLPHPDRVKTFAPHQADYPVFSWPEVRDLRDGNTVFSAVAGEAMDLFGFEANGVSRAVWGEEVSGQYFEVVGIQPALGRLLQRSDDDHPGASDAAVISYPAWKAYFSQDPNIIGKTVRINKNPYTIVGVTPEGFYGTEKFLHPDFFVPMANEASLTGVSWLEDRRKKDSVFPILRIKDGVTVAQAQAEMNTIAARIQKQDPANEDGLQFWLAAPGLVGDFVGGPARRFLFAVMVLAGILLLAACANLGSLFASRTADRAREIAIRLAVGSSRWRILRQVLIEAFVISILGGAFAAALSWVALGGLARWQPPSDYPIRFDVTPRPLFIVVSFLISIVAGVLFGVMPLWQIFKADPNDAIKSNSQATTGRRWALRDFLLAGQIALCCVTVTAAFVALRGLNKSLTMDVGFNPKNVAVTKFDLSQAGYTGDRAAQFQRQVADKVRELPGVEAVAYSSGTPLSDPITVAVFSQTTADLKPSSEAFEPFVFSVSPGYFSAAQTPLLAGRDVSFNDTPKTPRVAVVNQTFAQHMFHSDDAVGKYFKNNHGELVQIVGVVGNGKYFILSENPQEAMFLPITQQPSVATTLIARTRPDAMGVGASDTASAIRRTIRELDPAIPLRSSGTWTSELAFSFFPAQVAAVALGIFGVFGLLLSIAGTFGLASYTVSKRVRELSIRVALGAQARQIFTAALGRMMILLATGSAIGIVLGAAASRLLAHVVYQASALDPLILGAVAGTMLLTGMLSIANPVRRALRVDPSVLLREE
jgi:predicted permease